MPKRSTVRDGAIERPQKRTGLLDDTLLVWTTEFGRTPGVDGDKGRGHHSASFSSWMAGAGVKPGISYGSTDDIGATVAENRVHVHDFHATILYLLGIDHTRLTYRHAAEIFGLPMCMGMSSTTSCLRTHQAKIPTNRAECERSAGISTAGTRLPSCGRGGS